ncbi:3-isopropylmalate dehydratase small subunit [Helicobacter mustelae]|uniref:3-isopropylmalate dehydratase small subunit n=1 Tax=Helicobacter mustelae TaxID=217 RepID=UPI000DFB5AF8|nr:3-isopropylmalate dehydratase small subunit [Helicobacter mustelae]STP12900.1 3-isopropylmalate dehydratase small subunit [Helicobacter mustelae]
MQKFEIHKGRAVALWCDNIDTDQLIPKTYLKRIEKSGFGEFLFDDWRYNKDRSPNKNFVLNAPENQGVSILVTGENFGSGSSREHAVWALMDYGFAVIIAGSFSDIFYNNAIKNALLPISLPLEVRKHFAKGEVEVDLRDQVVRAGDFRVKFEIDPKWKQRLLLGLDEIAITLKHLPAIESYEQNIPKYWQDY